MRLQPRDQVLFNPGPVNLDPEIHRHLFDVELCHRQDVFDELLESVTDGLFAAAELSPADYGLGLLHGSGTLAVDAALATFVRGTVLVIDNGVYCARLAATAGALRCDVVHVPLGLGVPIDLGVVDGLLAEHRPDWLLTVHHETTTGILNPIGELVPMAHRHGARVLVDAVSSLGVHPLDVGAEVVCFNSGKCLEALPGIAGVFHRRGLVAHPTVPVLDVTTHTGALPSTPNIAAFVSLGIVLDLHSTASRRARYERLARHVWRAGEAAGFEFLLPEAHRSHVLTSFRLPNADADADALADKALAAGFVVYHGQGALRGSVLRVANMGAKIDEATIDALFDVLGS
jgi:2-aminoethylphosphonate-pyruvate transaminase